jgi:SAM-dependent methyltransferase
MTGDVPSWTEYYDAQEIDREPRELLVQVLDAFGPGAHEAVELGCGQGIDTLEMLRRGWSVLAVDAEPEGIRRLLARVPDDLRPRLVTRVARMEDVDVPPVDLVWASFSLFFCPPERFDELWARIRAAIRPGGRVAGHLLGDRDTWAPDDDITAHTRDAALQRLDGLEVERFDEEDEDGEACSGPKHWHVFHFAARRAHAGIE